jgi:GxxExxY protein
MSELAPIGPLSAARPGRAFAVRCRVSLITTPEATEIIGCAIRIHTKLGPGIFESVYEDCMAYELSKAGLSFRRQVVLPVVYDGVEMSRAFVVDFIVEDQVLVELKSVQAILPVHDKQVLTYLRLSGLEKGILMNFNAARLKDGLKSYVLHKRPA